MPNDRRMDVQQLVGLTDQGLIVYAIREATMMLCKDIEPGTAEGDLRTRLLSVLDRDDVVAARNRLEHRYGMRPLPISED
jgi:hypothetical protein